MGSHKAVFLDRDGTLIVDKGYLFDPNQIQFIPLVFEALLLLKEQGYRLMMVTNQSGIARGYFNDTEFKQFQEVLLSQFRERDISFDAVYYCPHHPEFGAPPYNQDCDCRKPKPGMILEGISQFSLDPTACFMIGDSDRDVIAAQRAGVKGILLSSSAPKACRPDFVTNSLLECVTSYIMDDS